MENFQYVWWLKGKSIFFSVISIIYCLIYKTPMPFFHYLVFFLLKNDSYTIIQKTKNKNLYFRKFLVYSVLFMRNAHKIIFSSFFMIFHCMKNRLRCFRHFIFVENFPFCHFAMRNCTIFATFCVILASKYPEERKKINDDEYFFIRGGIKMQGGSRFELFLHHSFFFST